MNEKKAASNQSVEKMFSIIEEMANHERCRLQDIAKNVGLPPSTVMRLVNTLCRCGYAAQDPQTQMYYLTYKFVQLGQRIRSGWSNYPITHADLLRLVEQCGESCCVGIEQNGQVVYVDVADCQDSILRTTHRIGKIAPLHTTGLGKILLLNYTDEQIRAKYSDSMLPALTPNSITTVDDLLSELDKVRKLGYALDDEECEIGVRCVAMGIRNASGTVIAGVSVSGPVQRMTEKQIRRHREILTELVTTVEKRI